METEKKTWVPPTNPKNIHNLQKNLDSKTLPTSTEITTTTPVFNNMTYFSPS